MATCLSTTLEHVNEIRAEYCLAPLKELCKGYKALKEFCPISSSIAFGSDLRVRTSLVIRVDKGIRWKEYNGRWIQEFVGAFDRGDFPEYEI